MALILKEGKSVIDAQGNVYTDAYLVIDQNNGNKGDKVQHFEVQVYKDQQARQNKKQPIQIDGISRTFDVTGEDFDTYFSPQAIADDTDHYKMAYEYIKLFKINTIVNDEEVEELLYNDWEDQL
jgi:hypothetical protein